MLCKPHGWIRVIPRTEAGVSMVERPSAARTRVLSGLTRFYAVDWTAQKGKHTMKNTIRNSFAFTCLTVMVFATQAVAQPAVEETTTTTTTTTTGTVSQFGPDTLVVRTTTSPNPVTYGYTKTTTYVDESGQPVTIETVKSGVPVTVHYDKSGDRMVATKVVVKKTTLTNPPR